MFRLINWCNQVRQSHLDAQQVLKAAAQSPELDIDPGDRLILIHAERLLLQWQLLALTVGVGAFLVALYLLLWLACR